MKQEVEERPRNNSLPFRCNHCHKSYSRSEDLGQHERLKHPSDVKKEAEQIAKRGGKGLLPKKKAIFAYTRRPKEVLEYQQAEDKLYTFLADLGTVRFKPSGSGNEPGDEESGSSSRSRLGHHTNYLNNTVVRMPFDSEFGLQSEISSLELQQEPLFSRITAELLLLHRELRKEKTKWDFMDPVEASKATEPPFTLLESRSLLATCQLRGLELQFPETSIFLLWVAKITTPQAWRDLLLLVYQLRRQYEDYLNQQQTVASHGEWKEFMVVTVARTKTEDNMLLTGHTSLFTRQQLQQFLRLYSKWVWLTLTSV